MNSGPKILLLLLALAAAGFGLYFAFTGGGAEAPLAPTPPAVHETDPADQPVPPVVAPTATETAPPRGPVRELVDNRPRPGKEYGQGVKGRLVDAVGQPVAGARVFLFEGHGTNLFAAMMEAQRGVIRPPAASADSEADGTFQLGVAVVGPDKTWELRVTDERHADEVRPNLTIFEGQWHDCGSMTLKNGLVVEGRVVQQASGAPVPGATVLIRPSTQTLVMAPTPGREEGIMVKTDAGGNYRFFNATPGIATVAAYAPEHARVERINQNIRADGENRFDFELPPGKSIAGTVTDGAGTPISMARVQVLAISSKNPLTIDQRTDRDGRYEALGLVDGPYQVLVTAQGFVRADEKPVMAGETRNIVLETQGTVSLKVMSKSGRLLNNYTVTVKSYIAQQDAYGNLLQIPEMRIGPRDVDNGFCRVSGLDPGNYALEVQASGFAKGYSEPFEITVGGQEPVRTVELSEGGAIAGSVIGVDNRGIANVQVSTFPNEYEDNPLSDMFAAMIPYKISKTGVQSGGDGRFKLDKLTPGTYQLRYMHPDHYTVFQKDIVVEEGRTTEIQPLRLMQGTQLSGTVTLDGAPGAQIKVQVSAVPDPTGQTRNMFSATAVTDDQGRFVLPKRLPPGNYQGSAGRQANPFQMVVDYQQTKQEFTVGPGQPVHQIYFRIQSQ